MLHNRVALANEKRNALKREGDASASMKVLIAVAQAKQRARHVSTGGSTAPGSAELQKITNSMVFPEFFGSETSGTGESSRHLGWNSNAEERAGSGHGSVDTEATVARDTFVGMLETLSRTKDSIGRATRQAMDSARHGIADQVKDLSSFLTYLI